VRGVGSVVLKRCTQTLRNVAIRECTVWRSTARRRLVTGTGSSYPYPSLAAGVPQTSGDAGLHAALRDRVVGVHDHLQANTRTRSLGFAQRSRIPCEQFAVVEGVVIVVELAWGCSLCSTAYSAGRRFGFGCLAGCLSSKVLTPSHLTDEHREHFDPLLLVGHGSANVGAASRWRSLPQPLLGDAAKRLALRGARRVCADTGAPASCDALLPAPRLRRSPATLGLHLRGGSDCSRRIVGMV
jgi:hypothetical protein